MLDLIGKSNSNCEGMTRRGFLKIGSLGLAGLTLPDLLRLRAAEAAAGKEVADYTRSLPPCNPLADNAFSRLQHRNRGCRAGALGEAPSCCVG